MSDPKQDIVDQLQERIDQFKSREHAILEKALDEGGVTLVLKVIDEERDLEGARFDLIQRALDANAAGFSKFAKQVEAEIKKLERDIDKLESVAKVLGAITSVINFVGRLLIKFGL